MVNCSSATGVTLGSERVGTNQPKKQAFTGHLDWFIGPDSIILAYTV